MSLSRFTGVRNVFAYAFGVNAEVPALKIFSGGSNAGGTYSITLDYGYITAFDGTRVALTAKMPINLGTGTLNETITPTTVSNLTPDILGTCVITGTFTNAHGVGELVNSGDGGLSVAATAVGAAGVIAVDLAWATAVGATLTHAGVNTKITSFNSVNTAVALLDWTGFTGALAYGAASGSAYASRLVSTATLY